MTRIRHFLLLLAALALTAAASAQTLIGDLNHNGGIDVGDVTLLIDDYLTGNSEDVPYTIENSRLVGTWWLSVDEYLTFYEDNTSDFFPGARYRFFVVDDEGLLVFYNQYDLPMYILQVPEFTGEYMVWEEPITEQTLSLTRTQPASIELSEEILGMNPGDQVQLTAYFTPEDATVYWSSDDTGIATVRNGLVTAVAVGTAIITAEVEGVQATCTVRVIEKNFNNGHEFVDLGLSVKWATMNIGASSPEDYGDYFAWGETSPKASYSWDTYKLCENGDAKQLTKYNNKSNRGMVDNKFTLDLSDDAARANWEGEWHIPTTEECEELTTKCTWKYFTQGGVNGCKVTGPNGQTIFLPAAGYINGSTPFSTNSGGLYWSSSLDTSNSLLGIYLILYTEYFRTDELYRYIGFPVRAVCP